MSELEPHIHGTEAEREEAAHLLDLLEHQRQCTHPAVLRGAQVLAVVHWMRQAPQRLALEEGRT